MKKLTIKKNTAAGILAGIMLTACTSADQNNTQNQGGTGTPEPSYEPADNENTEVYGPATAEINTDDNDQNQSAVPEEYDPDENINVAVYGPPPIEADNSDSENGESSQP